MVGSLRCVSSTARSASSSADSRSSGVDRESVTATVPGALFSDIAEGMPGTLLEQRAGAACSGFAEACAAPRPRRRGPPAWPTPRLQRASARNPSPARAAPSSVAPARAPPRRARRATKPPACAARGDERAGARAARSAPITTSSARRGTRHHAGSSLGEAQLEPAQRREQPATRSPEHADHRQRRSRTRSPPSPPTPATPPSRTPCARCRARARRAIRPRAEPSRFRIRCDGVRVQQIGRDDAPPVAVGGERAG